MPLSTAGGPNTSGIERYGQCPQTLHSCRLHLTDDRQHVVGKSVGCDAVDVGAPCARFPQVGPVSKLCPLGLLVAQCRAGAFSNEGTLLLRSRPASPALAW